MLKKIFVFLLVVIFIAGCTNVNKRDKSGKTNFMKIVEDGNQVKIQKALNEGAKVNEKDDSGVTALMIAVENCDENTVLLLVQKGADVNAADNEGYSVMKHAKRRQYNDEIIAILFRYGAID